MRSYLYGETKYIYKKTYLRENSESIEAFLLTVQFIFLFYDGILFYDAIQKKTE